MLEIQFAHKLLHNINNKPSKLADKFLKWLDTKPTFISSVIAQSYTKCCRFIEIILLSQNITFSISIGNHTHLSAIRE